MLYQILRNRLKQRTNKNYVKWRAENKTDPKNENHHLLGSCMGSKKQNDYLLAEISKMFHQEITYNRKATEDEFTDMFIDSLESVFDYIEGLEMYIETTQSKLDILKAIAKGSE